MSTPQEPETPEEYLKRLNEQYGQSGANPYQPDSGEAPSAYGQPPHGQPAYGQPPQPPQGQTAPAYGQPSPAAGYGHAPAMAPQHPSATLALVLGLIALVGSFLTCGLTLVVGPFAWFFGAKAVREIDAGNGTYSGRQQANAGKVMGILSVVLLVLAVIGLALLIGAIVTTEVAYAVPSVPV